MPFKSYRQQKYMFWKHPKIAERWAHKYGTLKKPKGYKGRERKGRKGDGALGYSTSPKFKSPFK